MTACRRLAVAFTDSIADFSYFAAVSAFYFATGGTSMTKSLRGKEQQRWM